MKFLVRILLSLIAMLMLLVITHLAIIELGREVVTLRTTDTAGAAQETRLWIVEVDGASWLHSAGPIWARRFDDNPLVEVARHGRIGRYTATPVPGPHPDIDAALREKYGFADRWVRWIAPCGEDTIPVRLEPVPAA